MEKRSGNEEESRKPEKKRCKTRGGKKIKGTVCFICHIVRCIAEFKLRINENSTVGGGEVREGFRSSSSFQRFIYAFLICFVLCPLMRPDDLTPYRLHSRVAHSCL